MAEKSRKDRKKKTRRRKIRRDADISSSSSSSEDESQYSRKESAEKPLSGEDVEMTEDQAVLAEPEAAESPMSKEQSSEADFDSWYLRQVTKELEDDLDQIRSAGDFKDSSLPVLVTALQQGASLFSTEEKRRIVGAS
ncbi:uncharacterized protein PV09_05895 [Verruconis gallopava]|uniref:Ribosome assembly protein 3 n=1 Tax=Verruconis gallopava TaxID=253628 RepID=A0A0D2A7U4_9PEZI|nr:uncharacterized protein PV09_05895 [Verruconis gallopava]KIW02838.1 hypothetical protein PV09_05895 [Verruconis gallopava]